MLEIIVEPKRMFNSETNEFFTILDKSYTICLEHSLVSVSKWESKWKKPFLTDDKKTEDELIDYIKCMTITKGVKDEIYNAIKYDANAINQINDYIKDPMTASKFYTFKTGSSQQNNTPQKKEVWTSETIYAKMFEFNIPMECQKWHINKLLTQIRVCAHFNNIANGGGKMSKQDTMRNYSAINKARRAKSGSKG